MDSRATRRKAAIALLAISAAAGPLVSAPLSAQGASARPAAQLSVPPIAYKMRKLANGLTVYSLRDTSTPTVSVSLWYEVGAKHDPEGRSGFAHMFEHILSRKTVNMPYNMIYGLTADVGGTRNASTSADRTNYYEIVPARYLETMLWTHAERMARPVVDSQIFESERNVVKEELRERVLAPPYGRLFSFVMTENAYDTLPNRRSTIGSIKDLDAATLTDALAFHEAYYGPDTASLIVAGNFDEAQLQGWVDKYFAAIPARANKIPLKIDLKEPPRTSPRLVNAYAPNVPLPVVATLWKVPGTAHPDMAALSVLDGILGTGESSRLHKSLVYQQQLATSIGSSLGESEDGGFFAATATLAGGKEMSDAERALAAELERVRSQPVSAAELAEAKNEILASSLRQRETASGRAFEMGEALVRTGDPKFADKRLGQIMKVTAADVQRVARKYLAPNARVDIRYMNEKQAPAGQQAQAVSWANPFPMPKYASVPPPKRPPNQLAPEASRQAPPAPGPDRPVTQAAISEAKLPTGLSVVTAKTGDVPLASMTLVVRGGASTDPTGKSGLASMAAELAAKGTATRSAQQIASEMEALGATLSSNAGPDGLLMSVSAPAANLEAAGRILADIVQNATFPAEELERERKLGMDRLSIAMKNPGALAEMIAQPVLYGSAPYGSIPTPASLRALTREDLARHRSQWWHPANSALVIAGGIDSASASGLAQRLFGGWRGEGTPPPAPAKRAGAALKPRTLVIDMPGAGQAAVLGAVRAVSRQNPDYFNLLVANAVLGGGSSGRLFEEIRTKKSLSYGAGSGLPSRMDDAALTATSQTKNETAAEVAQIFLGEFDRLGKEPLTADTIDRRKAFLVGNYTRQAESSAGFSNLIGSLIIQGLSPGDAARYAQYIEGVAPDAVTKAAARLVRSDAASLVIVGDASKFIDKLRAVRPNVEVIKADQLDLDSPLLRGTQ
jgi:zinc protease